MRSSSAVRSKPISERGPAARVVGLHSSSIWRTSSRSLSCGARPKPTRAMRRPIGRAAQSRLLSGVRRVTRSTSWFSCAACDPPSVAASVDSSTMPRTLARAISGWRGDERLHRDAAHRVAHEHHVVELEAYEQRGEVVAQIRHRETGVAEHRGAVPALVVGHDAQPGLRQGVELPHPRAHRQRHAVHQNYTVAASVTAQACDRYHYRCS